MEQPTSNTIHETTVVQQPHYALTAEGQIVILPAAEYPAGALHQYTATCEMEGREVPSFPVIFNQVQYKAILSHVAAELNDVDGDGLIPTYMVVTMDGEQPVFPHASVDSLEEVAAFIDTYPVEVAGPIELITVRDEWPKDDDSDRAFQRPASQCGLLNPKLS